MVVRPVEVSPVQNVFPIVDPDTGRATETFQYYLLKMWERTGGFKDEFFEILTVSNLGQIQGLISGAQLESLERKLGDANALARLSANDRISAQLDAMNQRLNLFQALSVSKGQPPPSPALVVIDDDTDYMVNRDAKTITVAIFGGGGGGGAGSATQGGGGGGGAGYSIMTFQTSGLPSTIPVTIGLGGNGGTLVSPDGQPGGDTSFGGLLFANGGMGGLGGGTGGTETPVYGNLFQGGPGSDGATLGPTNAPNDNQGGPGGGGGGGPSNIDGIGGDGAAGSWRSLSPNGDGGSGGGIGLPGDNGGESDQPLAPGLGAGGGGGSALGTAGAGGTGGLGAGGGGGGASAGTPGVGGPGGKGRVYILENL